MDFGCLYQGVVRPGEGFWWVVGHSRGAPVLGKEWYLSFVFALYQGDVGGIIQSAAFRELLAPLFFFLLEIFGNPEFHDPFYQFGR